ncbi:MAG TPA: bacterioferritin-associated ferredoxin [Woeseiaceae bacterium]|jgi:bacterioferritin-associated ferredoxin
MYVCICNAVTDKQIRRARNQGLDTLEDLREALGVASCCGTCTATVEAILEEPAAATGRPGPQLYIPTAA